MPTLIWQAIALMIALAVMGSSAYALPNLKTWVILVLGLVVYGLALLLLPRRRDATEIQLAPGVTQAELDALLLGASVEINKLMDLSHGPQATVIRDIANAAAAIIAEVRRDPGDSIPARSFFETHLPSAVEIVSTYSRLNETEGLDAATREQVKAAGELLPVIERGFREQHKALVEQDLTSLKIGAKTLTQTLVGMHGSLIRVSTEKEMT